MALRDAAGFLSGLRRVAAALYAETTSELQRTLSGSSLASSLYKSAGGETGMRWSEYGELRWARGLFNGVKSSGGRPGTEFFPEWGGFEEGFPSSEGFPGTFKHSGEEPSNLPPPAHHENVSPSVAGQHGTTQTTNTETSLSRPPPPPPPTPPPTPLPSSLPPGPSGSGRGVHTLACLSRPHTVWHNGQLRAWFHSGTEFGNETVVGGGSSSAGHAENAKSKSPKPKQKVKIITQNMNIFIHFGRPVTMY